jgi:hypothetical protein
VSSSVDLITRGLQVRVVLVFVWCLFRVVALAAFYSPSRRVCHLFHYSYGTKLHNGWYLHRVVWAECHGLGSHHHYAPCPMGLAREVTHLGKDHSLASTSPHLPSAYRLCWTVHMAWDTRAARRLSIGCVGTSTFWERATWCWITSEPVPRVRRAKWILWQNLILYQDETLGFL